MATIINISTISLRRVNCEVFLIFHPVQQHFKYYVEIFNIKIPNAYMMDVLGRCEITSNYRVKHLS